MRKQTRYQDINKRKEIAKLAAKARRRRRISNFIHSDLILGLGEALLLLVSVYLIWLTCWILSL